MKMIDVTSSTAHASSAEATAVTAMNFLPEIFGIETISCTTQVKKPRSRSAPSWASKRMDLPSFCAFLRKRPVSVM